MATTTAVPGIQELEQQYVLQNYARYPLVITSGKGVAVYDDQRRRYLDFLSGIGVNALGHAHPRIVKVVRDQVGKLVHCSNLYYNEYQGPLAARLAEISGLQRTFFCNSGAESMEGALKMARAFGTKQSPDKYEIVALENSFHGRTFGALSITGQAKYRQDFEPLVPGVRFVELNRLEQLEQAVSDRTCAIVLEPILGEGGIFAITREFVERAAALAQQHNALLIFDEIQCGVGRTGAYFAYQLWHQQGSRVVPDILCTAKPLGCGFPLGVILANERAAAAIGSGMHGTTFGGGALVCRVALEFLSILPDLLPAIRENGRFFRRRLQALVDKYDFVTEVRGEGLMVGLQLTVPGKPFVLQALEKGFLINATHETVLRFLPPYIVEMKDIVRLTDALDKLFAAHAGTASA
jgi:predicted acetylornithine/succinylornithine family transaminase